MVTTLPVPVVFELPDGWGPVDPDAAGSPEAAFVAQSLGRGPVTPTITIDGELVSLDDSLTALAVRSIEKLASGGQVVELLDRREVGSDGSPGLVQALGITVRADDTVHHLIQEQVYVVFSDRDVSSHGAVVRIALTVSRKEHGAVLDDFATFVRSVALDRS